MVLELELNSGVIQQVAYLSPFGTQKSCVLTEVRTCLMELGMVQNLWLVFQGA